MQGMTLQQVSAAKQTGGIADVVLSGQKDGFLVQIVAANGVRAVLTKARSDEPRLFGNPAAAFRVLQRIGITQGHFDASDWSGGAEKPQRRNDSRSKALRKAHKAAAYNDWLAAEIQQAIDDPKPNVPHEDAMQMLDASLNALDERH